MRTFLDEILTMETAPSGHSCGCKHSQGQPDIFQDELLSELSGRALGSAVRYNRRMGIALGWRRHLTSIAARVLRLGSLPSDPAFAQAVAKWQSTKSLRPDGKLGQKTWETMKPLLVMAAASSARPGIAPKTFVGDDLMPCPVTNPGRATDRCLNPGTIPCPPIPNLMCMRGVNNIPFEYVHEKGRDRALGLDRLTRGEINRQQKFVPPVRDALIAFTRNMARFGMPIKSILTLGSLYCRCVDHRNTLSNHSYGEAIDVAGVRWQSPHPFSRVEDTVMTTHNLSDPEQGRLYQRMNACLRLSFKNVIDYHRSDHRDHFHCDLNRGGRALPGATVKFVQQALGLVLNTPLQTTGAMDAQTYQALTTFSGVDSVSLKDMAILNQVLQMLFEKIAAGNF